MKTKCVICKAKIVDRKLEGKAITCNQHCAGKLAWKDRTK